jgi:hypothetical protein
MAAGYDGTIRIDSRIDGKGFNTGMRGITGSLKSIVGALGGVAAAVGVAFGLGAVLNFGKTAVDVAVVLASAMMGLQSVMDGQGRSFADAKKFINDYTKDGLIPATNAIIAYKNLALRGYDDTQIQKTLLALKDSAAFGRRANLTMGEAVETASEGLKNENSILVDNAGVTKNVAKMWDDYAKSIGTTAAMLTKEQKIQAEVAGIMEETKFQTGDAAKMSGSFAGQIARLGTGFYNFKVAVGNAIIPVLSRILPYIQAVIDWLVILFNTFARVLSLFFNVDSTIANTETNMGGVADNAQAAADAEGELADNTKAAGKAAKGALAAFDELNVLQKETGTGSSGAKPSGSGVGPNLGEPKDIIPDALMERIQAFKERLMALLTPAREALGRLREALIPLGRTIWEGLKWAWDNILVPLGEWVITEAVPAFLDLLAAGAVVLNEALIALKPLGIWLWENFLKPIAEWTGQLFLDALKWMTERLNETAEWIQNNQQTFQILVVIFTALAAAVLLVVSPVAQAIAIIVVIGAVIGLLIAAVQALIAYWPVLWAKAVEAWEWIKQKWNEAGTWFKTHVIDPIANFFKPFWNMLGILANNAWAVIKYVWSVVSGWFKTNVIDPLSTWFSAVWEDIKGFFSDAWDAVKVVWEVVSTWFQTTVVDPIKSAFETALDSIKEKWETIFGGIKDFVKTQINSIIDFLNRMLSGATSGINGLITGLNTLAGKVPGWVTIPAVAAPQIPRLAKGAVIPPNSEFAAILGDQRSGRNIETPEALMRQIVREEMRQGSQEVVIRFDGSMGQLVRMLKPYVDKENARIGTSLIQGGASA